MSKLVEIRKALGKLLFNFSETEVDGIVYVYETLAVGEEVFVYDEEGNKTPAPNATFELDGQKITIEDGRFSAIEPIEAEDLEDEPKEDSDLEERVAALEIKVAEILAILNETVDVVETFATQENGQKIEKKVKVKEQKAEGRGPERFFAKM